MQANRTVFFPGLPNRGVAYERGCDAGKLWENRGRVL